jgi:aminobenzoyl-glutamate utilization protein B
MPASLTRSCLALLPLVALALPAASGAAELPPEQGKRIVSSITRYEPKLSNMTLDIWRYAELGFQEQKSSRRLADELKQAGFSLKWGVAGMSTAFIATYRRGKGPVIGLLAEYDALPGLSQTTDPVPTPAAGRTAGHGCGHNLFGAAAVAAALAVKQWMDETGSQGEVRVYGSPAEEGGAGKIFLVREGLFNDVDAAIHWHPGDSNSSAQGSSLAVVSGIFRFRGTASHAATAPELGRSALDAVEIMNVMTNYLREHVPQEARIHYVIINGGSTSNVVPDFAESRYGIRHPTRQGLEALVDRVKKNAEAAALATGTSWTFEPVMGMLNLLPNDTLGRVMDRHLRTVGGVQYSPAERAWAEKVQATLELKVPIASAAAVGEYAVYNVGGGSTDVGDVSQVVPTVGMSTATWVPGTVAHSWQAVAASGTTIGAKGASVAAKAMALTAAELMLSPDVLVAAKAELERRRGPGFTYRALIGDRPPALDYQNRTGGAGK